MLLLTRLRHSVCLCVGGVSSLMGVGGRGQQLDGCVWVAQAAARQLGRPDGRWERGLQEPALTKAQFGSQLCWTLYCLRHVLPTCLHVEMLLTEPQQQQQPSCVCGAVVWCVIGRLSSLCCSACMHACVLWLTATVWGRHTLGGLPCPMMADMLDLIFPH